MDIAKRYPLYCTEPLIGGANDTLNLESYEHVLDYAQFGSTSFSGNLLTVSGNASSTNFIWAGTFGRDASSTATSYLSGDFDNDVIDVCNIGAIGAIAYNNGIYLHKDHPDLENIYSDAAENANNAGSVTDTEQKATLQAGVNNALYTMPISAT